MSLAASECGEWAKFSDDSAPPLLKDDMRVLTKAVQELGLDWTAPEEPAHSKLDEWFLQPGRRQQTPELDWKEAVIRCLESVESISRDQPDPEQTSTPSTMEESCVPPVTSEPEPRIRGQDSPSLWKWNPIVNLTGE
ncbi:hypothetical protein DPX16_19252 [Anabarilius grahami]|uniref:Uncharacterized protein n=1 Tax=Anabarilius grahami TaxID=495550 RepID=A0A3N0Z0J2_ANAGA|nr:hypothetical protein DPX16_19252 [Anabarilius grahami]